MRRTLLYLIGELRAGGSERQLCYLLRHIDRTAYQAHVVVWNFNETDIYVAEIRRMELPIHTLSPNGSRLTKLKELRNLVGRIKPHVIHSYSSYTNFAAYFAALGRDVLAIGSVRSDFQWATKEAGPLIGRLSGRWPCVQIFNSYAAAKLVGEYESAFVPKQRFVVTNGVDLDSFREVPSVTKSSVQILGIGSLFPVKRWDRLTIVASELCRKGFKFRIRVVGSGPLLDCLAEQATSLGVEHVMEFAGHSSDIATEFARATFVVHPSDSEGCPNVVMEAMAAGRAVVATDVGDVSRLIDDGQTGFVVPPADLATFEQRIATLIANPDLCCTMGAMARAKADRDFGLNRMVAETFNVYRSVGLNAA